MRDHPSAQLAEVTSERCAVMNTASAAQRTHLPACSGLHKGVDKSADSDHCRYSHDKAYSSVKPCQHQRSITFRAFKAATDRSSDVALSSMSSIGGIQPTSGR